MEARHIACMLLLLAAATHGVPLAASEAAPDESTGPAENFIELTPDTVLVSRGEVDVTLRDFEAFLASIPEKHRKSVANNPERIAEILETLLKNKLLAREAVNRGLNEDPDVASRLSLARYQVLAKAELERAGSDLDGVDVEQLAREHYLVNQDRYRTPERVTVRHVLIGTGERAPAEAEDLAHEVARKARNGEVEFEELVREYSDDSAADSNEGRYTLSRNGQMVAPFENAVFELEEPGEIAGPVETRFGYHVIKLEKRYPAEQKPFSAVRDQIMEDVREKQASRARQQHINDLMLDNEMEAEREIIQALRKRYQPENRGPHAGPNGN